MADEPRIAADLNEYLADPSTVLPPPIDARTAARRIVALHALRGGATFNLFFGDLAGASLFAVAIYPESGRVWMGKDLPEEIIEKFIDDNRAVLSDPRISIGTWYNADNGLSYLDLSAVVADRDAALLLAREYNQIAIYDLAGDIEIPAGGTGDLRAPAPPTHDRLPPINRGGP